MAQSPQNSANSVKSRYYLVTRRASFCQTQKIRNETTESLVASRTQWTVVAQVIRPVPLRDIRRRNPVLRVLGDQSTPLLRKNLEELILTLVKFSIRHSPKILLSPTVVPSSQDSTYQVLA